MGEIADAMLDGTLCEGCGVFLGDGDGFPAYCGLCAPHKAPKRIDYARLAISDVYETAVKAVRRTGWTSPSTMSAWLPGKSKALARRVISKLTDEGNLLPPDKHGRRFWRGPITLLDGRKQNRNTTNIAIQGDQE